MDSMYALVPIFLLSLLIQQVVYTESSFVLGSNRRGRRVHDVSTSTSFHRERRQGHSGSSLSLAAPLDYHSIVTESLDLTEHQYEKLDKLCHLVLDWNQKINLISRQHSDEATIWERHILPSLAAVTFLRQSQDEESPLPISLLDVGTGGGFPGLPLAIACPDARFCLLDSVGKKLVAVKDMAEQLELTNVQTHYGRAEDYRGLEEPDRSQSLFHVATSRSVSALPNVCAWMHHLLVPQKGRLLYWIGDRDDEASNAASDDIVSVDAVIPGLDSDKRIWTVRQPQVSAIAKKSGVKIIRSRQPEQSKINERNNSLSSDRRGGVKSMPSKGAWKRKDPSAPKDRGYAGFQRYNSLEDRPE